VEDRRVNVVARLLAYGVAGLAAELAWTSLRGRPRTSLWMLPVYGGAQLTFEPVHEALRPLGPATRACAYGAGFTAWEYASGRALRMVRGAAPWDYGRARVNLHGLIRADYVPLWACAGLAYERLHDALTR
jgi:hypothetical protein